MLNQHHKNEGKYEKAQQKTGSRFPDIHSAKAKTGGRLPSAQLKAKEQIKLPQIDIDHKLGNSHKLLKVRHLGII